MGYCSNNCSRNRGHNYSSLTPFGIIRAVSHIGCGCRGKSYFDYNGYNGGCDSGCKKAYEYKTCGNCARDYVQEVIESDCGCSYVK